jgi:glycosyltransferase involved in cell wall biosynthesis
MRILVTADPEIPVPPIGYGGIERIVDALVRTLQTGGHHVGLVAHRDSTCPADIRFDWRGASSQSMRDTIQNAAALRRAIATFQPEVVHSFSRLAYLLPELPTRLPKVMSYQRHTGGRSVAWAARLGGDHLRFTGCSEFICTMGRAAGGRWTAIHNFVEPEKIAYQAKVPRDAPLVFLSRIERIKGPDLAIAAVKAAGRRLLLAGNRAMQGSEREFWECSIAPHLGRDGIEYVGEVNDAQKNELLGRAAGLIVPVQWDEPFGIVFIEALATGTPVITCARGALPEIVEPGRTGFFIENVEDGAKAIQRLPELERATCRRIVESRFAASTCAARYLETYREVIAASR